MHPEVETNSSYGRRIAWLGGAVIVLIGLWSAAWYYLADRLIAEVRTTIERLAADGSRVTCDNPTARGYPFRLGLFCDKVAVVRPGDGVTASAGAFRTAAQIYDPRRLVAELDGPANVETPAGMVEARWEALRASVRLADPLPERVSLEGVGFSLRTEGGTPLVSAESFQGHMRPNGADLDVAGTVRALALDPALAGGRALPRLEGEMDLTLKDGIARLRSGQQSLRGQAGQLRSMTLSVGGNGALDLSGPISVDENGLLNATLKIAVREPEALSNALGQAFPEAARGIEQAFAGVALFGSGGLPLTVRKGRASLGFIPLGDVPPLE